jgi:hypothetical protein
LMVLSSLVLADEIFEMREENERLKSNMADANIDVQDKECIPPEELERVRADVLQKSMERETEIAYSISEIAVDIQGLAKRLQSI